MEKKSKVVIMYLLWDQEPYKFLADAIEGVIRQSYPKDLTEFLIVYNSHKPENKSACPYIREQIEKHIEDLPHVTILEQEKNLGFSGGNNLGMKWGIDHGFDYVFLHNGDGYLGSNCLEKLVTTMEGDKKIGAAQSLVLLHPDTDKINSAGNCLHYLGVGYCDLYKIKKDQANLPEIKDVGYLSGAAIMMRTDLLKEYGLWDEDYFMYHEDTDYSLRLRLMGYRIVLVRDSEFFHKYSFSGRISKYFWIERNRISLWVVFYKWGTIFLLLPIDFLFELGLILFSVKNGWFKDRIKVYAYWLKPSNLKIWLEKRKRWQASRKINDKELLKDAVSIINFQEKVVENPLVKYIANPVMFVYWAIAKRVMWW